VWVPRFLWLWARPPGPAGDSELSRFVHWAHSSSVRCRGATRGRGWVPVSHNLGPIQVALVTGSGPSGPLLNAYLPAGGRPFLKELSVVMVHSYLAAFGNAIGSFT
jgi:hypothetical protein